MGPDEGSTTAIELQHPYPTDDDDTPRGTSPERRIEDGDAHEMPSLPPVDGGKDAWLFLAACFMIEALVWGL